MVAALVSSNGRYVLYGALNITGWSPCIFGCYYLLIYLLTYLTQIQAIDILKKFKSTLNTTQMHQNTISKGKRTFYGKANSTPAYSTLDAGYKAAPMRCTDNRWLVSEIKVLTIKNEKEQRQSLVLLCKTGDHNYRPSHC